MSYVRLRRIMGQRSRCLRLIVLNCVFVVGYLLSLFLVANKVTADEHFSIYTHADHNFIHRSLLTTSELNDTKGTYPDDLFTLEQRRQGAVILHILGMIYMFVALAIVCDEFFVPALGVITERFDISEDVAGATFMAAGGSAPELFTSIIGVFMARTDVGIGTIVGSAVFNILFVIGMCAVFSKEVLRITWWPLFRDVTFYSIDLILLIVFFVDDRIEWWESLILFLCYITYVTFMKFNHTIETFVKNCLKRHSVNQVASTDDLLHRMNRRCSVPILHSGSSRFRHGVLQLLLHTLDPLGEEKVTEKAIQLSAVASMQYLGEDDANKNSPKLNGFQATPVSIHVISNGKVDSPVDSPRNSSPAYSQKTQETLIDHRNVNSIQQNGGVTKRDVNVNVSANQDRDGESRSSESTERPDLEEEEEPLDLSWPDTARKRITYILLAPVVFPLWITLPDVRIQAKKKWYYMTFLGSILWIAVFSYFMVWWANQTGETIGIPPEVMGLTILAAGTSIPDLITSVIVAKKGYGDMAVSSSVGSNIFDITVGLPLPWMIYSAIYSQAYKVTSDGLLCSIILLFLMLIAVIIAIAASQWQLKKGLGFAMFFFYFVFLTLSVLLEFNIIPCPQV